MTRPTTRATRFLVLDFEDRKRVVLRPKDVADFEMLSDDVLEACVRARRGRVALAARDEQRARWVERLKAMLGDVRAFCEAHSDAVRACYLTVRDAGVAIYFVLKQDDYDVGFDGAIDGLEDRFEQEYPEFPTELGQLPAGERHELSAFIDFERGAAIYEQPASGRAGARREGAPPR